MAASNQDNDSMITAINITPMVDVMLVLLVIFMMAAPTLYNGSIKIELPKTQSGEKTERITLKFELLKDGKILLDRKEINLEQASEFIKKALALDPKTDALIAADQSLSHGTVIQFIDQLKVLGIQRLAIAVDQKK